MIIPQQSAINPFPVPTTATSSTRDSVGGATVADAGDGDVEMGLPSFEVSNIASEKLEGVDRGNSGVRGRETSATSR